MSPIVAQKTNLLLARVVLNGRKEKGAEFPPTPRLLTTFSKVYCNGESDEVAAAVELARITPD